MSPLPTTLMLRSRTSVRQPGGVRWPVRPARFTRTCAALTCALLLLPRPGVATPRPSLVSAMSQVSPGKGPDPALRLLWVPESDPSEMRLSATRRPPEDASPVRVAADDPRRERVVAAAVRLLEQRTRFRDCSAFVQRVFRLAGETVTPVPLPAGRSLSESMFRASRPVESPRPGDIAVFHNTYDANRDGKRNDRYTHISVVESVDGDVVTLIHRGGRGLARHRMNLAAPDDETTNSPLRRRPRGSRMRVLAGQLFAGYGDLLLPGEPESVR
ncbi:MAG TPA: CHAP domain-containing protein [Myxococcaceae bacterium]|nr:CHAP domain-containing protein [Myxococcaceae bacterium]